MKTKKIFLILVVVLAIASLGFAQRGRIAHESYYKMGQTFVTAKLGVNSWGVPFGVSVDYGLTENISVGGSLMFEFWNDKWNTNFQSRNTLVTPAVEGAYHFTSANIDRLDVFAGLTLGINIYSYNWKVSWNSSQVNMNSSSVELSPFVGAKYFFSQRTAVLVKGYWSTVGDFSGVGALVGLAFRL
ncbi:MAG: hypothetical protein ACM3SY_22610 [Candidatus Omnitrophota bacterium]